MFNKIGHWRGFRDEEETSGCVDRLRPAAGAGRITYRGDHQEDEDIRGRVLQREEKVCRDGGIGDPHPRFSPVLSATF